MGVFIYHDDIFTSIPRRSAEGFCSARVLRLVVECREEREWILHPKNLAQGVSVLEASSPIHTHLLNVESFRLPAVGEGGDGRVVADDADVENACFRRRSCGLPSMSRGP